jgi:four helix bundle protein
MSKEAPKTHKDLDAWKRAMELAERVYVISNELPQGRNVWAFLQMRRSAVSIASNIHCLDVALGSVSELETQAHLDIRMGYLNETAVMTVIERMRKLLLGLIRALKQRLHDGSAASPITHHPSRR